MRQRQQHDHDDDATLPRPPLSVTARHGSMQRQRRRTLALRVYHWFLWLLLVLLLLLQPLGFVWQRIQTHYHTLYGQVPENGVFTVYGSANDEPFTDRAIVCNLVGRLYKPTQLSALLATANTSTASASSSSIPAYRVIPREGLVLSPHARDTYANMCDQIATTLDGMLDACAALGYNVSGVDSLSVVSSSDDDAVVALSGTLPVLILPFWDNGAAARFVVPSHDGHACMFRLSGKYLDASLPYTYLSGVDRATRASKTATWLQQHDGVWRHGWFEHPTTQGRWYADVYSTESPGAYGIMRRQFDTTTGVESDCVNTRACHAIPTKTFWGTDLYVINDVRWSTSITILDVHRTGLFLFEGEQTRQTFSTYRLETLIANISVTMLLFRWLVALVATHRVGETIGLGALSCARSFHVLPIVLLPRLKMLFAAFWTAGCVFEGDQRSLSEAWFVMYPSIAEFTLLLYSLHNLTAKLLRRRVSDALFGPTLLALLLLHRMRSPIALSGWFEMSGRVATRVSSAQFDALRLVDFFSPRLLLDLNGAVSSIVVMKLVLLALNLVPFVVGADTTSVRSRVRAGIVRCDAEKALALRVACNGGLGRSRVYATTGSTGTHANPRPSAIAPVPFKAAPSKTTLQSQSTELATRPTGTLLPYELARAGYVVLGHDALVSMKDWFWFLVSAPCRAIGIPMRHLRMVTFTVVEEAIGDSGGAAAWTVSERPTMCRVTDERFQQTRAWAISVRPLQ